VVCFRESSYPLGGLQWPIGVQLVASLKAGLEAVYDFFLMCLTREDTGGSTLDLNDWVAERMVGASTARTVDPTCRKIRQ